MTGDIIISDKLSFCVRTIDFDYLINCIRAEFEPQDAKFQKEMYWCEDEACSQMIRVDEQGVEGFKAFFNAATKAQLTAASKDNYSRVQSMWDKLLDTLRSDPRYSSE
jgi:hypothetical protein